MSYKIDFTSFHNVINNELTSTTGSTHGIDASTETALPDVPLSGQEEVDRAVDAASAAFQSWRALSWDERGSYLSKLADAMEANHDDLRDLLVNESGKPFNTANTEMQFSIGHLRVTSGLRLPDQKVVKEIYEEADTKKWNIALGGLGEKKKEGKGFILPPTIIDNPADDSRIVAEEPFGPVLPTLRWTDEADVIRRANGTEHGLGASVWSKDVERAIKIADQLVAGSVWVNCHFELGPQMPFGGHKASGMGMEWGTVGLQGWCNAQSFWTKKL